MNPDRPILIRAGHLVDAVSVDLAPGAILLERHGDLLQILAMGSPEAVAAHPHAAEATVIDRSDATVFPGLVNAHTHLDLTHIGPVPLDEGDGFETFVALIRSRRHTDPHSIRASVRAGIEASLRGGVVAVGDIAGAIGPQYSPVPFEELCASPLWGTSYIEFFAFGDRAHERMKAVRTLVQELTRATHRRCRLGIQPHAPYSVDLDGYRFAIDLASRLGIPLMSHVSESQAEREFIAAGSGPFHSLLVSLGLWSGSSPGIAVGRSPVEHLLSLPGAEKIAMVHLNYLSEQDLQRLSPAHTVVYCPRSSTYFRAHQTCGVHQYAALLERGVAVALGTDSLVNLMDQAGGVPRISTWDDMCLLYQRDGVAPRTLLQMATVAGAKVLSLPPELFAFGVGGYVINLAAVRCGKNKPGLAQALADGGDPELLVPTAC